MNKIKYRAWLRVKRQVWGTPDFEIDLAFGVWIRSDHQAQTSVDVIGQIERWSSLLGVGSVRAVLRGRIHADDTGAP
jgi:hypothetical protein